MMLGKAAADAGVGETGGCSELFWEEHQGQKREIAFFFFFFFARCLSATTLLGALCEKDTEEFQMTSKLRVLMHSE